MKLIINGKKYLLQYRTRRVTSLKLIDVDDRLERKFGRNHDYTRSATRILNPADDNNPDWVRQDLLKAVLKSMEVPKVERAKTWAEYRKKTELKHKPVPMEDILHNKLIKARQRIQKLDAQIKELLRKDKQGE